ncbi:argininosuccinate lyase [Thalassovita mangrovi]|uniref:Argininosuccinate lyase n=1 Tax=Thalassovita mangrovi TaxID=2692236 RepID=A0A6L8LQ83_9RHOB|nr:argininosuccinate lyase [Thalassovita mangrovi]MYM57236.1 argininosuccinate lyase [Thalassovita mangrovi]
MKRALILIALLGLAACGADGEPTAPAPKAPKTGVTVSGEATIGISF